MDQYYVESVVNEIAKGIKDLINREVITKDKKIVLYGLDNLSFAIKTILANFGFRVEGYISDSQGLLIKCRRRIKATSARYLNSHRDLVGLYSIEEKLIPFDEKILVINASRDCPEAKIESLGYEKNISFFQVYDWDGDVFAKFVRGKRHVTLQEIQDVQKDMLYAVDKFCSERKIRYWVCGGTLLGTIRHKGFIPWDDDVDIFMPWKDYQRFLKEFAEDENYGLITPDILDRKNYIELFAKMTDKRIIVREDCSITRKVHPSAIDIFPIIGLPTDMEERQLFFIKYYELERKIWEDFYSQNGNLEVYNKWYPLQKEYLEKYDFDRSVYVGVLATIYKERDCTRRKVYDSTLRMSFEDIVVNVPVGYKEYLNNLYGEDWKRLPEESKRVSHHNAEVYWM